MPPHSQLWLGGPGAPPCLLRGTLIRTPLGDTPVETLAPGDVVVTASGGHRRVVWVGGRRLDLRRHPNPAEAQPVRIRRGALGNGVPGRDLVVSPDHALLLNGVLIPAHALVNGATVRRDGGWSRLDYHHVALDAHDALLAEGAAAESLPERGSRAAFDGERLMLLHPRFADVAVAAGDCAPRVVRGAAAAEVRRMLLIRARVLGHPLTRAPDLHLLVDGARCNPIGVAGQRYRFAVPEGTADIRIVSRAGVPAESDPMSEDRRRLGVMLSRIVQRVGGQTLELPIEAAALCEGFHPPEAGAGGPWRWTDGHARLPPPPPGGALRLDLYVAGVQPAWARAALPDAPMHRSA